LPCSCRKAGILPAVPPVLRESQQLWDGTIEAELDMVGPERPRMIRLRCEECDQPFDATLSSLAVLLGQVQDAEFAPGEEAEGRSRRLFLILLASALG
jgi:hypothetical protein